ncbi:MAG: DUF3320 domain-containing protein [Proteobacteria bacterium]|nr:DUF3320 domain-containing protein [Pseudomonadota bacterium]MBU4294642.1 DUF3320 domain-containing protein [Pseudomonadota bacterium]MCG2745915.1 DUF3320 domain-containing protein [Desulfobulbaceae bacterium]
MLTTTSIDCDPTVNYAMQQNDVPVVKALRIVNETDAPIRDAIVRITTEPAFAATWESRIAVINPQETFSFGAIDLHLSHDFLASLTERVAGCLHVEFLWEETCLARLSQRIEVLAFDEWNGLQSIPEVLAAFVTPNHPAVESVLSDAAGILGTWTGDSALSGYQPKDPHRVALTAGAVYAALQKRNIRYINPPASFEEVGQKIRLPDRILESRLATCLDLAVFVSACLEQAGLHPLVVLTEGHAFVGVWLEEETFADVATDDLLRLRKRVELGQITVFETTLLTSEAASPFDNAMNEGLKHLEDEGAFRCVIDIRRARKSRIRPLPLRIEGTSTTVFSIPGKKSDADAPPILNLPSLVAVPNEPAGATVESSASRLDRWKQKLLDLTLHNRLLNFRESKKSLPVLCPDLAALEDALADGAAFRVYPRLGDLGESDPRNAAVHRQRTGQDSLNEMLREEFHARRLHADVTEGEVNRRLLEIYREAKSSIEENGANTLYLALGFLAWYETKTSSQRRLAPIILIPLEIERRSLQEGFSIRQGDDEPMVNVTLLTHLAADFELHINGLDPIPMDEHGIDVSLILRKFRESIVAIDRWEVLEYAYIGHFSFTKFLMWRDLEVRAGDLERSAIVRHLIHTPTEVYPDNNGVFPDLDHLDETHSPEATFCPLSADSSQLAAVHAAAEGKSFVLHGPPGTGKSQTITNIIAHNLAVGKTVLFVSEKRAALAVVHRRLAKVGLGPFCLELHSNKSHKKEILFQLEQALNIQADQPTDEWRHEAQRLQISRAELNAFVKALHAIRLSGESVFHGISQLIAHRDVPLVRMIWPAVGQIDRGQLAFLRDMVRRLQMAGTQIGYPATHVWSAASCEIWTPEFRNDVERLLEELREIATSLAAAARGISTTMGMGHDNWSRVDLKNLSEIVAALCNCPPLPQALLLTSEWEQAKTKILELVAHGRQRDSLRANVFAKYSDSILTLDLDALAQQWERYRKAWALPCWLGYRKVREALGCAATQGHISNVELEPQYEEPQKIVAALYDTLTGIAPLVGVEQSCWSRDDLENIYELSKLLINCPALPQKLLLTSEWEYIKTTVLELIAHGRQRDILRSNVFAKYNDGILSLDLDAFVEQWAVAQKTWALPRWLGCRKIRKALGNTARQGCMSKNSDVPNDIKCAAELRQEEQFLKNTYAGTGDILGAYWRGGEADWNEVEKLLRLAEILRQLSSRMAGIDIEGAVRYRNQWAKLATAGNEQLSNDGPIGQRLRAYLTFFEQFVNIETKIASLLTLGGTVITTDLNSALALRREEQFLREAKDQAGEFLGVHWRGGEADWNAVEELLERAEVLRKLAGRVAGVEVEGAVRFRSQWAKLIAAGHAQLTADAPIGQQLQAYGKAFTQFTKVENDLTLLLGLDSAVAWGAADGDGFLPALQKCVGLWLQNLPSLKIWCHWRAVRKEALAANLQPLIEVYESQSLPPEKLQDTFTRAFYQCWGDAIIGSEPVLCGFISSDFEDKIRRFREIDERYTQLTQQEIQARVAARLPHGLVNNPNSEMGLLRRQCQKQRAHMPVRALFQKIPNLLPRLKPCLLMSPISIAQYLDPAHPPFDLVIFDEASQIPVWDAVGAIARGKEAIIVGDPKQLPPTNFFSRVETGEGADTDDSLVEDLESILDDCIAAQLPERHLNWHYRSRHESLITFSNFHYYDNRLLTFPSPHQELGVSFRQVPGVYDKGKTRTNKAEAEAIVAEVMRRLVDPAQARFSIGVITFSLAQQLLVDDLLEEARRQYPEIDPCFSDSADEPVFVKNLENVQGDERDVILFSICYGPDAAGRVSMNFGPLNRDGGERRLNVAITRARQEVVVFSTLRAEQIDLSRTRARGVTDLKCFLDYAERGPVAIAERRTADPAGECESPFESQVHEVLQKKGYTVHPQVGCSGYRIDLAVVDPNQPGRYLLGIECDGANYHRSKTARDRDKLRESVLRGLGWKLHRIWSTDWWERPAEELARIEALIEEAKRTLPLPETVAEPTAQFFAARPASVVNLEKPAQSGLSLAKPPAFPVTAPTYEPFALRGIKGALEDFYDGRADNDVAAIIDAVVNKEGPVCLEIVARRVAEHWTISRLSSRVITRIKIMTKGANVQVVREGKVDFLWPLSLDPHTFTKFRLPGGDERSRRNANELPPQEIANAALYVLEQHISLPSADLVRETARLLGFQRTGPTVDKSIRAGIELLIRRMLAKEEKGMIVHVG